MVIIRRLGERFEKLCAKLLELHGFKVELHFRAGDRRIVDMVATNDKAIIVIELKVIRTQHPSLRDLRDAIAQAKSNLDVPILSDYPLVILSCTAVPEHLQWLEAEFEIKIWDRVRLEGKLRELPRGQAADQLKEEFDDFFLKADEQPPLRPLRAPAAPRDTPPRPREARVDLPTGDLEPSEVVIGAKLAKDLKSVGPGKAGAKEFENIVQSIIEYLFGEFLLDRRPQSRTEDDLSIMDIVYRVRPGHPFWDTLTRDFRCRAVLFECKNYSEPITPSQIYSTERYVQIGALRSVCFLISRLPPHPHAELAAFGAMREGSKLFVLLDDSHMNKMLEIRDAQLRIESKKARAPRNFDNDPSEVLDQTIYDFLSRMGR